MSKPTNNERIRSILEDMRVLNIRLKALADAFEGLEAEAEERNKALSELSKKLDKLARHTAGDWFE